MIRLEPVYDEGSGARGHFILRADEPVMIEARAEALGGLIAWVYRGTDDDMEQEPLGVYDATMIHPNDNVAWEA